MQRMTQEIYHFLCEMATEILSIVGVAFVPLIVLIMFRAGRLRGLTQENMAERLGDLCFDTIKDTNKLWNGLGCIGVRI